MKNNQVIKVLTISVLTGMLLKTAYAAESASHNLIAESAIKMLNSKKTHDSSTTNPIKKSNLVKTPESANKMMLKPSLPNQIPSRAEPERRHHHEMAQMPNNQRPVPATPSLNTNNSNQNNPAPTDPNKVVLNFENADIQSVIKAIGQLSGKNFVIDPRVKGTVNIVSDQPVSKADSYKVLETALRMQGFACVEADGVIKVLPEVDAKTYGMSTMSGAVDTKKMLGDQLITKVFVITHGSATQLANALRPLIAPNNTISVYTSSNAIVITDYSTNMARIAKVLEQLTTNNGKPIEPVIITLKHAIAADVSQLLQSYQGVSAGGGGGGGGYNSDGPSATVTVDPATNSIIISSSVQEKMDELKAIALKMDHDVGDLNNNLHVVYLKNADANHIADVLRTIVSGQENPDITASSTQFKFTNEPGSIFASTGGGGGASGGGGAMGGGGAGAAASHASSSSKPSGGNASNQKDAPKVLIQAEPTTNSLIIQAPEAMYHNLRMIIDMLDVRRAQVMIEAMIVDVNQSLSGSFGIQWIVGGGNNNAGVAAVSNYGGNGNNIAGLATNIAGGAAAAGGQGGQTGAAGAAAGIGSLPQEVYVGLVTGTTTIGGQTVPGLGALADMIEANSAGNIISRPTLITLDNEEARIQVGTNIGIPNGNFTNTATNSSIVNTITRTDLGTFLQIKPLITENGAIQLDVYQEDSKLDANQPVNSTNGPSFLKRNMRTSMVVDDGQIIAIGGMTSDTVSLNMTGIPLLSNIPYLGWLFSWQSRVHNKTDLVLFLRPVIIKNADGYKALSNEKYNYVLGEQSKVAAKGNALLPRIDPVTLENQVGYKLRASPSQQNPSLNLNTDLPIVDMRASSPTLGKVISTPPGSAPVKNSGTIDTGDASGMTLPSNK